MSEPEPPPPDRAPTLLQVIGSVLAAMFGVQSSKARQRDFTRGRPLHYIVVGILAVLVLIAVLLGLVRLLLHNAGM
ncbi:MAG TPA: DUF2970 domain-containing protein [Nevskiaceae bacterium]|nr:DUF2970 domain-containing protein [Nevskiaceae bacterium]